MYWDTLLKFGLAVFVGGIALWWAVHSVVSAATYAYYRAKKRASRQEVKQ